jgi:hypothetical protein
MRALSYIFLLVVGVVGATLYVVLFVKEVPGFAEQRFGKLEDLPPDVGKWRTDSESEEARKSAESGLQREVRHWWDSDARKLFLQVRHRDTKTNEIVRVEPDVVVKRRRVKV